LTINIKPCQRRNNFKKSKWKHSRRYLHIPTICAIVQFKAVSFIWNSASAFILVKMYSLWVVVVKPWRGFSLSATESIHKETLFGWIAEVEHQPLGQDNRICCPGNLFGDWVESLPNIKKVKSMGSANVKTHCAGNDVCQPLWWTASFKRIRLFFRLRQRILFSSDKRCNIAVYEKIPDRFSPEFIHKHWAALMKSLECGIVFFSTFIPVSIVCLSVWALAMSWPYLLLICWPNHSTGNRTNKGTPSRMFLMLNEWDFDLSTDRWGGHTQTEDSSMVSWSLSLELCEPLVEQIKLLRHQARQKLAHI